MIKNGIALTSLLLAQIIFLSSPAVANDSVTFLVGEAWSMPFGKIEKQDGQSQLVDGVMKDFHQELALELKLDLKEVFLPKKRILKKNLGHAFDLQCFSNPNWVGDTKDDYHWLPPFFEIKEFLVSQSKQPKIESEKDFKPNTSIGTVMGYHYGKLDPYFANKTLIRDDAVNEDAVLQKGILGRTTYFVMRSVDFMYQQKINPAAKTLQMSPYLITNEPVYCGLSKKSKISFKAATAAQERILKSGRFDKFLKKYGIH